jgi:hypothetical protein
MGEKNIFLSRIFFSTVVISYSGTVWRVTSDFVDLHYGEAWGFIRGKFQ